MSNQRRFTMKSPRHAGCSSPLTLPTSNQRRFTVNGFKVMFVLTVAVGLIGSSGSATAGIVVHGSTTAWQETGSGDWLTMGTNDIDGSGGLGTDGFIFYHPGGENISGGLTYISTSYVESLPSYISSHVEGADFNVINTFSNMDPAGVDDPVALDGTDVQTGIAASNNTGGGGALREVMKFTVSNLPAATTVRVGVYSGNQGPADGRWQPTSITLSDGTNSATVGNHSTSALAPSPGGTSGTTVLTGGWVYFDIDADGTYALSGTVRSQGVSFAGLTFDSVVPEPSTFVLSVFGLFGLLAASRRRR